MPPGECSLDTESGADLGVGGVLSLKEPGVEGWVEEIPNPPGDGSLSLLCQEHTLMEAGEWWQCEVGRASYVNTVLWTVGERVGREGVERGEEEEKASEPARFLRTTW
jgi:hypothetical protein